MTSPSVAGWIFDAYPKGDKMIVWIKQEDGSAIRLEHDWSHSIYVAANDRQDLVSVVKDQLVSSSIKSYEFVSKREKITDTQDSTVLKLTLSDSSQAQQLAKHIMLAGRFGQFRLYNVDIMPAQTYFYEHELFPLALCEVEQSRSGHLVKWDCKDDVWALDYKLPQFKTIRIDVNPRKQGRLAKFTDEIGSILIRHGGEDIEIENNDEMQNLFRLAEEVAAIDPDFVFTDGGDSFIFPYLAHRAKFNKSSNILVLGRDCNEQTRKPAKDGTTYFSYGRIHYRPSSAQLFGRVHIDIDNSFIMGESGLQGLYEVARICRMPLHKASRASIGRCMSSLQCYYASLNNILVPWKSSFAEHFKTYSDLFIADRGGMILEPRVGVHEQVAEFDFQSLYPSIMSQMNLSGETVLCNCCSCSSNSSSSTHKVPELGWHICDKRDGIVPQSLKILLTKRAQYKQRIRMPETDANRRRIYDARQSSLKWILVTSFGYLGYSNSKFGNIDAHIATCAFDRQVLLKAVKTAESHGFRVLHGIVDSIWVYRKGGASRADYLDLKETIEKVTGFAISFEGVYKWVAFVHSTDNERVPVPNRYFGAFEDGSLKIRGIEARRHDTPVFFTKCQQEVLKIMATGNTVREVRELMPAIQQVFDRYVQMLRKETAPLEELVFTKQTSKDAADYHLVDTAEQSAINELRNEGKNLRAGEALRYIITDYRKRHSQKRTTPIELIDDSTTYDVERYVELLANACNSVTYPFGYSIKSNDKFVGSL